MFNQFFTANSKHISRAAAAAGTVQFIFAALVIQNIGRPGDAYTDWMLGYALGWTASFSWFLLIELKHHFPTTLTALLSPGLLLLILSSVALAPLAFGSWLASAVGTIGVPMALGSSVGAYVFRVASSAFAEPWQPRSVAL